MGLFCLRNSLTVLVALYFGLGTASGARAADMSMPTKAPTPSAWTYTLTPYVWAISLNGSTTVKGRTTDVNASFIDILDHTEFPKGLFELAAFGEARNGRWGIFTDIVYLKLGLSSAITRSRAVDALNASLGASAGLTVEMVIAEAGAAYEVAHWTSGTSSTAASTALDLYAAGRAWWQRADAQFQVAGTVNIGDLTANGDGTRTASGNVAWVDPVVGLRLRHQFSPGVNLVVSGDVGGFGAASKFSWQAIGALSYELQKKNNVTWSGMLGYKALSVNYSQGSGLSQYEFNMTMHGPIIGLTARF
jgi:hypothetical protein